MVNRRAERAQLLSLLLLGYLGVWTVFGLVVHAGDAALHSLVASQPWLAEHAALIGTATLLLAGVYQFTPLKYQCLERCRSPLAFVAARWRGRQPAHEAFQLGVAHGLFCVGCCWSLMLLMFAVGVGSLGWMFALAIVIGRKEPQLGSPPERTAWPAPDRVGRVRVGRGCTRAARVAPNATK